MVMRIGFLKIPICYPKERHFISLGTFVKLPALKDGDCGEHAGQTLGANTF